ncbi:TIM barrel protein [Paracoccus sp. YIM 132242]|uniref:TIM barrel protein n=1 Tax=Paracoccus lichenicola TaxID=2665644 RepID=A0A6L6HTI0_9RHOB|nr:TIM barrel protein [Paracoccus lichenicola]MTE01610.1 TIM barrel protein [Paracoccus lichenicola]
MTITITTAPCCWGVDDVSNPDLPPWRLVLAEAAAAGYGGLELGPYGYMPLDAGAVSAELRKRGLYVVAGTIFDNLVDPANRENLERQARRICAVITALPKPPVAPGQRFPAPYLTVMDWGHDARDYAAGHSDRALRLDAAAWAGMIATIRAIARIARDHGVRAVIHPHAGGHIEFADEIDRICADIPASEAGLCLDTGHTAYAGMDPVATLDRYWDRLDYIHFKDINAAKYAEVMARRIRFFDACAEGVMCPIGDGSIDYPGVLALLERRGYAGFITVEQERDPRNAGGSLADVAKSRRYLERVGFARHQEETR